jgi:hypothetical protein
MKTMFGRRRRSKRWRHDEESRAHALEVVERLAEESGSSPREIERHRLSRAAMDRQRISRGEGTTGGATGRRRQG